VQVGLDAREGRQVGVDRERPEHRQRGQQGGQAARRQHGDLVRLRQRDRDDGVFGQVVWFGSGSMFTRLFGLAWLCRFAAVEAGHHVEAEQAAFERAVEERRLARFLQAQHLRQRQVGGEQVHGPAGEALLQRGGERW
jgi:hypothetical protein